METAERSGDTSDDGLAHAGGVIWLTGLSGAGKTTVATELARRLRDEGVHPIVLDGDELRAALGVRGSFDAAGRRGLAYTYARLCRLLSRQGHVVICATISLFHEVHAWNREHLGNYLEILLDVPFDELARRNTKGLYDTAAEGEDVAGVGLAAEFPEQPDLVLSTWGTVSPGAAADHVLRHWIRKD